MIVLLLGFPQKMLASAALMGQIQNVSLSVLSSFPPFKREGGSVLSWVFFLLFRFVFCYLFLYFFNNIGGF